MNDYQMMEAVIRYLESHSEEQPDLNSLAVFFNTSPTRLHKLFHAWVGVTPKAFLQCLTLNRAKASLAQGASVLSAALQAGLSGPGRLHDLCCRLEAASPGEIKNAGAGWTIRYAIVDTPFAQALLAESPRGLCHIGFVADNSHELAQQELMNTWHNAEFIRDDRHIEGLAAAIFPSAKNPKSASAMEYRPLRALVSGSEFQIKVWRALVQLPLGQALSYKQLAAIVGHPGASRAVGSAMARNPLAYLIPCHRVLRETGVVGEYRWGSARKRCMLAWEQAYAAISSENSHLKLKTSA